MRTPPLTPMALQRWAVVERIVDGLSPRRVLEIGCGMGGFGARLASRYEYVGVEPDGDSFRIARSRIEAAGGSVIQGSVTDVRNGPFDLVCAFEVLEHIDDDTAALAQWVAMVSPGGHLLLSVPAGAQRFGPSDAFVGHYRRYDPHQIEKALYASGLLDVRTTLYGWPLGFLTESVRNRLVDRRPASSTASMQARTAGSGRWLQPGPRAGAVLEVLAAPFVRAQALRPSHGIGLVAVGRLGG